MRKLRCFNCGTVLDPHELATRQYFVGECWGVDAYDSKSVCPVCYTDDLYEVEQCRECGEWHVPEPIGYNDVPMFGDICEDCLCDASVDECVEIGRSQMKVAVEINSFLASAFTEAEIEDILIDVLKRSPTEAVRSYVKDDPEWFADKYNDLKKKEK